MTSSSVNPRFQNQTHPDPASGNRPAIGHLRGRGASPLDHPSWLPSGCRKARANRSNCALDPTASVCRLWMNEFDTLAVRAKYSYAHMKIQARIKLLNEIVGYGDPKLNSKRWADVRGP